MGHGPYSSSVSMGTPWVMGRTVVYPLHGSWIVQQYIYPIGYGLYNSRYTPWVMGCTMVYIPHGPWAVRQCIYPMGHGPYNSMSTPWVMGRTMATMMDYISRSCDFPKKEILMAYISILGRNFLKNYQKRKFDGLCKQVMWPTKKQKWRVGWMLI